MYCKNCGMICGDDASYCKRCGAPIQENIDAAKRSAKRKSSPWIPIVIILMAAVIGVLVFFLVRDRFSRGNTWTSGQSVHTTESIASTAPIDTLQRLEEALDDLNIDQAVECFDQQSRDTVRKFLSENLLEGVSDLAGMFSNAIDVELDVVDVVFADDTHCTVTVDGEFKVDLFGYEQSGAKRLEVPMVYENSDWFVTGTSLLDLF